MLTSVSVKQCYNVAQKVAVQQLQRAGQQTNGQELSFGKCSQAVVGPMTTTRRRSSLCCALRCAALHGNQFVVQRQPSHAIED